MGAIFQSKHKSEAKDFTRKRKLTFVQVFSLLLSKSRKSLQLVLNEFFEKQLEETVTASAFTQARAKFRHTAFIELNEDLVDACYSDGEYRKHKGFRLLSIDGSNLYLPKEDDISQEFGQVKVKNQTTEGAYVAAQSCILYDVLNEIVIDAQLCKAKTSEIKLAEHQLKFLRANDLVLLDRGFSGYSLFSAVKQQGSDFLARSSVNSFKEVSVFLREALEEKIVTLYPNRKIRKAGVSPSISVRLIKVTLDNGEVEILITSLLDRELHPVASFKSLYFQRWKIETYIGRIKSRLALECFTGKTAESVRQDFFSTIFVSNLETICTAEANQTLEERCLQKNNTNQQKVNKAVAFNIIKNNVVELLFNTNATAQETMDRIDKAFLTNPVSVRENRRVNRDVPTQRKKTRFHKYLNKIVF